MNDELFRKMNGVANAFDKIKGIADVGNSSLSALSSVDSLLKGSIYSAVYNNPALAVKSSVDILLKDIYYEPKTFNPIMSAFGDIFKMIDYKQIVDSQKHITSISKSFSRSFFENLNKDKTAIESFNVLSNMIGKINWRESYPDFFNSTNSVINYSKQQTKFNENLVKLVNLNIIDDESTLIDGLKVSTNLEIEKSSEFETEIEEIYKLTNQAFDKLNEADSNVVIILNKLIAKLAKFINHQYTVAMITGITLIILNYYITKNIDVETKATPIANTIEKYISEREINLKQKPIIKYKVFTKIPIGAEISVIEKTRKWAKVTFINSKGIPQIGYCRIEELNDVK